MSGVVENERTFRPIVLLGARRKDPHEHDGVGGGVRIFLVALELPAHYGHVRVCRESGRRYAHAEVGSEHATWPSLELIAERTDHVGCNRGVLRRPAGHGVDPAPKPLVFQLTRSFDFEVLRVGAMSLEGGLRHRKTIARCDGSPKRRWPKMAALPAPLC